MKIRRLIGNLSLLLTWLILLTSCQKPILENTPSAVDKLQIPNPDTTRGDAYPYQIDTPMGYPAPDTAQQATVTPSHVEIKLLDSTLTPSPLDMTPVPASEEQLATAMGNFEQFFRGLPFVDAAKGRPYREYYGCTDSQNAGSRIDYKINTQSAENIKFALMEYLEGQKFQHSGWKVFEVSDFLGYSWEILASRVPENENDALVIIQIGLLEYRLRATSEPFEIPIPTDDTGFPVSHVVLWLNYVRTPDPVVGYKQTDLLKTCNQG